jgi:hypothetical protein
MLLVTAETLSGNSMSKASYSIPKRERHFCEWIRTRNRANEALTAPLTVREPADIVRILGADR